jgi:hypothetical protein
MIVIKSGTSDKISTDVVEQAVPTAPVLLSAIDLTLGDVIRLTWSGGGPFYNAYFKKSSDITFILANPDPLPNSSTQYDLGGLDIYIAYDFLLRGVNGQGDESANSNIAATTTQTVAADTEII